MCTCSDFSIRFAHLLALLALSQAWGDPNPSQQTGEPLSARMVATSPDSVNLATRMNLSAAYR